MFNRFKRSTYRARPIPELLDGEDWEVRNSNNLQKAYVDFDKRQFVVPFEESAVGELVRAHEAMHVKITPRDYHRPDDMDFVTLQSIEDCRVHQGLRVCGIDTYKKPGTFSDKQLEEVFANNPNLQHPLRQAEVIFATRGLFEEKKCRELVDPKVSEIVDTLYEKYFAEDERNGDITSFEEAMQCAAELKEMLQMEFPEMPMPAPGGGNEKKKGKGQPGDQNGNLTYSFSPGGDEEGEQSSLNTLTEEEAQEAEEAGIEHFNKRHAMEFDYPSEFAPPGKMTIEYPKLNHRIKLKTTDSVKMTPSDEGVIPTRMHRYATDQKLFSRKGRRRAGAAVLIDVSGSMSLSNEMILNIIKQCPASIVGIYSGHGTNKGILRIVAEDGKYNTDLKKGMGGSNIIDIPAIEWLAKRKEKKKLWISDGWITTQNERMAYDEDIRKLTNTMRQARIERVGNVRELLSSGKLIDHAFDDGHELGRSFKRG